MRLQLLSDLHLEVHPHFVPTPAPGADLLVLAGDVGSYQTNSQLKDDDFGLERTGIERSRADRLPHRLLALLEMGRTEATVSADRTVTMCKNRAK